MTQAHQQPGFDFGGNTGFEFGGQAGFDFETAGDSFRSFRSHEEEEERRRHEEERRRKEREQERARRRREQAKRARPAATDPWAILGIRMGASQAEIRAAWIILVKLHHPDHGGDAARFREVQAAFERLRAS